ncbi:beta-ketoacyl-[acyl-carrier-protein] synthase I [Desulfolithobacter dissulfuricans]|uniref:3-oxoacyl-[acyl-carrier-protein] synthase 1 n=1 Tax=Desulfolithobacter dissulfuricans TaxID=2795293 RepID=A0A915XGV1_9BACT|nr:beta-ketoacyl-ACP synthase I [Desulfolithobacter dissulfuricans]BCO07879.1 beta-ketoacyl-[acyl-carrier-protein] synthase I [Desulfolithobacter dissulfuricans]
MRRVVITGMGIVSPLGDTVAQVLDSLRQGKSGVTFQPAYEELGLRSRIGAFTRINIKEHIDKKTLRFMGDAAAYAYIAMQQAIEDAGLPPELVSNPATGLIIGSGGTSAENVVATADTIRQRGIRRLSPFMVPRTMSSTVSAGLTAPFKIKGLCYSISSACATGAHCIGAAMEQIMLGRQDIMFAGGADEEHWTQTCMFDAMGALSSRFNDCPEKASRPYDVDRDGFVVANGAGLVVLEELEHARKRGAKIYGEIVGYGATADGYEMVAPSGEGAVRCIRQALKTVPGPIDYINAHGTSTPIGDLVELRAIREVFGDNSPPISSTKSLSGHSLGAAGVHEAIYCLLMLEHGFIAASANIENMDPEAENMHIVTQLRETSLEIVMSNSYGFGGTNACLVFKKTVA